MTWSNDGDPLDDLRAAAARALAERAVPEVYVFTPNQVRWLRDFGKQTGNARLEAEAQRVLTEAGLE